MGIAEAITRVKEGARRAGLEAVLRAGSIPAPLRPAAQRLADLLRADDLTEPVVSLNDAIAAHEAEVAHAGVGHAEMAKAGGVCPFSGMDAGLAGLFALPELEVSHAPDAPTPAAQPREPEHAQRDAVEPVQIAAASVVEAVEPAAAPASAKDMPGAKQPRARAISVRARPVGSAKKAAERPVAKPTSKAVVVVAAPPAQKKAQAKTEKVAGKLAAKASSSKTPARSTVVASARPAAKRPTAKAAKK